MSEMSLLFSPDAAELQMIPHCAIVEIVMCSVI